MDLRKSRKVWSPVCTKFILNELMLDKATHAKESRQDQDTLSSQSAVATVITVTQASSTRPAYSVSGMFKGDFPGLAGGRQGGFCAFLVNCFVVSWEQVICLSFGS